MLIEKIPALYGKALLEAADSAGVLDDVAEEVSFFSGLLAEDAELELFVESPSSESSQKSAVFEKTFRGKATDTFLNFLLLLVDKGRMNPQLPGTIFIPAANREQLDSIAEA